MGWRADVLKRLGAPVTKQNLEFLGTWQRWEGGHTNNDARFNWLNTTSNAPGAVRSINSVGVKQFDSYNNGIAATVSTLNNGRYGDLVQALRSGNPYKAKPVRGLSTWLSGKPDSEAGIKYAARVLGQPVRGLSNASVTKTGQSYGGSGPSPQQLAGASSGDAMFQQAASGFLMGRARARLAGQDPQGGLMELAQLRRQYQTMGGVPEQDAATASPNITKAQGKVLSAVVDGKPTGIRELFYDPLGAYDEGKWIGPIGNHDDHVHVSFGTPDAAQAAIRYAKEQGLRATENPWAEGSPAERGVHTKTSYHYQNFPGEFKGGASPTLGRALDVSSNDPAKLASYFRWVKKQWGL